MLGVLFNATTVKKYAPTFLTVGKRQYGMRAFPGTLVLEGLSSRRVDDQDGPDQRQEVNGFFPTGGKEFAAL
jgi:hypothetical protein